jgi:hypothetical protein
MSGCDNFDGKKVLFKESPSNIIVTTNTNWLIEIGMRLVTQKRRYYHPFSVLSKADCIADFVLNC